MSKLNLSDTVLDARCVEKPGFSPNLLVVTKYFCKKPGF